MPSYYEIADLVTFTLKADKKKKISNIDKNLLRSYPFANKTSRQSVVVEEGGTDIRFDLNVDMGSAADNFTAFQVFTRTVGDHGKQGTMQLRGTHASYSFDEREEAFNKGEHQIVDHIRNRKQNALIQLNAKIEAQGWGNAAYADRNLVPQGLLYHLPYVASTGTSDQFLGTYPTSYTDWSGVDVSVAPYLGAKSYGDVYTAVTFDDLILKIRMALSETDFMAPINPMIIDDYDTGTNWMLYCNLTTELQLEDLCKTQNDNHGPDLDSYNGRAMIRRIPITEVPYLKANTRNPVFGVNWGVTKNHVRWWMKDRQAPRSSDQPLAVTFDIFCEHQLVMYDRRKGGFNISKAA